VIEGNGRRTSGAKSIAALVALFAFLAVAVNAQAVALGGIHFYQRALSPSAARIGLRCRFTPSCSRYAEVVVARDGVVRGGMKAIARIARCGPWTPQGTRDDP
jgi:putative membrane protein insertion efficiency factor